MKRSSLVLIPILIFIIQCNSPKSVESKSKNPEMSIKKQIEKGAFLVDVRTPEEFAEGHIAKAVNMNVNDNDFESKIATLDKEKPVMVYCRSGGRSAKAAGILKEKGFKHVYDLDGGMIGWNEANKPTEN